MNPIESPEEVIMPEEGILPEEATAVIPEVVVTEGPLTETGSDQM